MKKKRAIYILVLFMLLLSFSVFADPSITIDPSIFSINGYVGDELTYGVNLTNSGDRDIYNVTFTALDGYTFPRLAKLSIGQSAQKEITVKLQNIKTNSVVSIVSFDYYVSATGNAQEVNVTISNSGFNPHYSSIKEGDTIIWKNIGNIPHSITEVNGLFNFYLAPNETISRQFNQEGLFTYYDNETLNAGQINVENNEFSVLANDPAFNKIVTFNQNIGAGNESLHLELLKDIIFMEIGSEQESAIIIDNNANTKLINLTLKDSLGWLVFSQNNFNLSSGSSKVVTFDIKPRINRTEDTNKTYNIEISATTNNGISNKRNLGLFVNYSYIGVNTSNIEDLINRLLGNGTLEEQISALFYLLQLRNNSTNNTQIIMVDPSQDLNLNLSREAIENALIGLGGTKEEIQRVINNEAELEDIISSIKGRLDSLDQSSIETKKTAESSRSWLNMFMVIIILSVISYATYIFIRKYIKREGSDQTFNPQNEK